MTSQNHIHLIVSSKSPNPVWFSYEEAVAHCRAGASVMKFASTDNGVSPDVVLVGCGAEVTTEVSLVRLALSVSNTYEGDR